MMLILAYSVAVIFSIGILGGLICVTKSMWDEHWGVGVLFAMVLGPMGLLICTFSFAMVNGATSPTLATLSKSEWECADFRRVGKTMRCEAYLRRNYTPQ